MIAWPRMLLLRGWKINIIIALNNLILTMGRKRVRGRQ